MIAFLYSCKFDPGVGAGWSQQMMKSFLADVEGRACVGASGATGSVCG